MKWALMAFVALIIYAIATGYMGGAKDAAANYNKLLTGKPSTAEQK